MSVASLEEFHNVVARIEQHSEYEKPLAFGVGVATRDSKNNILETYFPAPNFSANFGTAAILANVLGYKNGTHSYSIGKTQISEMLEYFKPFENDGKQHLNIQVLKNFLSTVDLLEKHNKTIIVSFIGSAEKDSGPVDVSDAYLRLHLLSHRLVKPHGINLTGIFKTLPNVAWTSEGAISIDDLANRKLMAQIAGRHLTVNSVDKFPRMADYIIPSGVRIADTSRVRLGAYLGEGTTIMHEGFVNFNAGCEGPNMIEGRISAGVFVKKGSDLGGGCSTMGTLSGGNNTVISIGEDCLLGANSGLGIPLGNRCTLEAGLYLTAGTKVFFNEKTVKAKEFSGKDDVLFRRNSQTGQVEAIAKANAVELNAILHSN